MNTIQLLKIISNDCFINQLFTSVYARDELPSYIKYPSCFIINTEKRNHPGEHWLAFFVTSNGDVEFFDPIGLPPKFYGLDSYLRSITKGKIKFSNKRVQGFFSNYCGVYCVYFLHQRARGVTFDKILDSLSDFSENDNFIKTKIKNIL